MWLCFETILQLESSTSDDTSEKCLNFHYKFLNDFLTLNSGIIVKNIKIPLNANLIESFMQILSNIDISHIDLVNIAATYFF